MALANAQPHESRLYYELSQFYDLMFRRIFYPRIAMVIRSLDVERGAIRLGAARGRRRCLGVEPVLELGVGQLLDRVAVEAAGARHSDDRRDGARADAERRGDLPMAPMKRELLPEDLSCLMHGESLCRHAALYAAKAGDPKRTSPVR